MQKSTNRIKYLQLFYANHENFYLVNEMKRSYRHMRFPILPFGKIMIMQRCRLRLYREESWKNL